MAPSRAEVERVLDVYIRAWETQDPDLIVTIFTESATYQERAFEEPMRGHEGIRRYWQSKVVGAQRRIQCRLLNVYLDGDTAIAEWETHFDDLAKGVRKQMKEVAILEFEGGLIRSLREYWSSRVIGEIGHSHGGDAF